MNKFLFHEEQQRLFFWKRFNRWKFIARLTQQPRILDIELKINESPAIGEKVNKLPSSLLQPPICNILVASQAIAMRPVGQVGADLY